MGKKRKVKRGFVKLRVMVDTQTMKIVALSITGESMADVTEFRSLLGHSVDAVGVRGDATDHSGDTGPDTTAEEPGGGSPPLSPHIPEQPRVRHPAPRTAPA